MNGAKELFPSTEIDALLALKSANFQKVADNQKG
jgi:hypothetical protein